MTEAHSQRKLAVILHADIVGSTRIVQQHESVAHTRIRDVFVRFTDTITAYNGTVHEIRGDALVAEFSRASDAVSAALSFQAENIGVCARLDDEVQPKLRIGISLGEVVIADNTVTGAGVVLAQRLEQLAEPHGVVVQATVSETVPVRLPFEFTNLGEQQLKGFDQPVRAFKASLKPGESVPDPAAIGSLPEPAPTASSRKSHVIPISVLALVLIAIVAVWGWRATSEPDVLALPTGPRIAVMPFTNLANESDKNFGNQLTEDITNALGKFDLFVFPPMTTRQLAGQSCQDIREAIGADRILEGTVRMFENRLRVTTRFLDARDCDQLWSQTYDRELTTGNIFAVQDDITGKVTANIGSLGAFLWSGKRMREIKEKKPENLSVYECGLLTQAWYIEFSEETHRAGTECYERAIKIEPDYWGAHAGLGWAYINAYKYHYDHLPANGMDLALDHLRKAVELSPGSQDGHWGLAMHRLYTNCDRDAFRDAAEKAIAVNPNDAAALAELGTYIWSTGGHERGLALVDKAISLTPRHPRWFLYVYHSNHFMNREFRKALDVLLEMDLKKSHLAQIFLASTYGHLGDMENATKTIEHILEIYPQFADDPRKPMVIRCHTEERIELVMDGLRKAGYDVPPADS